MSADDVEAYWEAIEVLEARETILQMRVASYPHLKERSAQKMERAMQKAAYPNLDASFEKELSTKELGEHLAGLLNGG